MYNRDRETTIVRRVRNEILIPVIGFFHYRLNNPTSGKKIGDDGDRLLDGLPGRFVKIIEERSRPTDPSIEGSPGGGRHHNDHEVAEEVPQDPPQRVQRGIRRER